MESDEAYFVRCPDVTSRVRMPFEGELGTLPVRIGDVPSDREVVVIVAVRRKPSGQIIRARAIAFVPSGSPMSH